PGVEPGVAPTAVERGGSASDPPEIKRTATPRDPKQSRKLAADAARALASGNRKEAESLFHQALAHDNRNGAALIGLSDIHFDRSEYTQAVSYAEKAVQASPRNGGYRIRLGDAYFKLLRYADAQGEYEVAKQLGNHEADERLAKVKARLGK
ncbi:MAG TPA: tetratricopeptide repeat protein, partial [Nannocystaceae bacterium]|nr:tetratricopeptide repeat protein [Nannocystaceae bacterium]